MKVDQKIKDMPWPEPYNGGKQTFAITLNWPVVSGERLLVITFNRNRKADPGRYTTPGRDFRLICSKKNKACTVLYAGDNTGKRHNLEKALAGYASGIRWCYPEISEKDEQALVKWFGFNGETTNHRMPELAAWVEDAIESEKLAERDARGELRDEDVNLCPEKLPAGLIEYIEKYAIPQDHTLIYKKGNVRGLCYCCGQRVRATSERFRQFSYVNCPSCHERVTTFLEGSNHFRVDYVENIISLQLGKDGKTIFLRQWHILRDPTAEWRDIPAQLEEFARYAIRGNKVAKWQHEVKEGYYMTKWRSRTSDWIRVSNVSEVCDGTYYFFLPKQWKKDVAGTSLKYCNIAEYLTEGQGKSRRNSNPVRFLLDWVRYPAVEKLWKAGYRAVVNQRVAGALSRGRCAVRWTKNSLQEIVSFPTRLLKMRQADTWAIGDFERAERLWALTRIGALKEKEIADIFNCGIDIGNIAQALGHAPAKQILRYLDPKTGRGAATYRDYIADCVALGLDLDDRSILLPKNLQEAHARTLVQVKHEASKGSRKDFAKQVKRLAWMQWEKDGLLIRLPVDGAEVIAEGAYLHHCVGGYVDRMAAGKTTILFIRRASAPHEPYYTLEYLNGRVQQCRTTHNKSFELDSKVAAFVQEWVHKLPDLRKKKKTVKRAA